MTSCGRGLFVLEEGKGRGGEGRGRGGEGRGGEGRGGEGKEGKGRGEGGREGGREGFELEFDWNSGLTFGQFCQDFEGLLLRALTCIIPHSLTPSLPPLLRCKQNGIVFCTSKREMSPICKKCITDTFHKHTHMCVQTQNQI